LREQAEQPDQEDAAEREELQARLSATQAHEVEARTALAERNELIAELQRELAELSEQAEQPDQEGAAERDELQARLSAAVADIAKLEAEAQTAVAERDELITELRRELAELHEQSQQPQAEPVAEGATVGRAHLLFLPSASGYALIEFEGPDPPSGTLLDVDGVGYVVRRVGVSPFPGSRLRCVYVEPV
jgi:septal ring factor EnvC (AmiA/AmiB activator)